MKHIEQTYPKEPSICNCLNVRRASRAITQFYDEVLKPSGLTIAQLGMLRHLAVTEGTTVGGLAKRMRIDRTTLNRNMKPLLESGFITIVPGEDSRTRQITLTEAGKEASARAWALWGEAQTALGEYLGGEDLVKLVKLMSKLEALVP